MILKKRTSFLFFVFLVSFAALSFGQEKLELTHGPYLVDPAEDAITVVWFTNQPATSWVEYAEQKESGTFPTWGGYPKIARASHAGLIDANTTRHRIRIENLEKGKTYKYRVNSKEILQFQPYEVIYGETVVGAMHSFTTLDPGAERFTFAALSDLHEEAAGLYELDKVSPLKSNDLLFLNGDILSWIGGEERIFDGFLDASVELFATEKPLVYIRGNHETRGPILNRARADLVINGHTHKFERIMEREGQNQFPILITGKRMILETKVTPEQLECTVTNTEGHRVDSFILLRKEPSRIQN